MKNNAPLYPGLKSARVMTAPELNAIRLSERRTVITPERLRRIGKQAFQPAPTASDRPAPKPGKPAPKPPK